MGGQAHHRLARLLAAGGAALVVTACATPKERIVYQRVEVPIFQACAPQLSPKPAYPTLAAPVETEIHPQMKTLLRERDMRQAREMELEAAVSGCAAHPPDS